MARPVITLTSDFGTMDQYSAILKASIISTVPDANVIDISQKVEAFDIIQAAYILENTYHYFPANTVHIVAVNLYDRNENDLLCFYRKGQYFIGPNNGVFTLIFPDLQDGEVFTQKYSDISKLDVFHVLSRYVDAIAKQNPLHEFSHKGTILKRGLRIKPVIHENSVRATVIHIDVYENVIVNLRKTDFEKLRKGREFKLYYNPGMPISKISNSYGDVPIGEVLCLFNTIGYLEIAINLGKAASLLALRKDETIHIDFID